MGRAERKRRQIDSIYAMGTRREMFLGDFLVEQTRGQMRFQLHHPIAREQVIQHNRPWEVTASGYHTVLKDGDTYRMYYRGSNFDLVNNQLRRSNVESSCYAESTDGINWVTPDLGLFEHDGSKANNIIWRGPGSHNFSVFIDQHPDCPESEP